MFPPFLIMHGEKDDLVPLAQAQCLNDALKKCNADVTLEVFPGAGHVGGDFNKMRRDVLAFFDKHLKVMTAEKRAKP